MPLRNSTLALKLRKHEPEVVRPARPTPRELKPLADLDNLDILGYQQPVILVYAAPADKDVDLKDPSKVIKAALAEALVYYYPWAGRLKESTPGGRLVVDCTAEGVLFVEADADARLDQFGEESLVPPFPCAEQLLYNKASDTFAVVDCPMFTIQVTRMLCGGFIVAFNFSHVMSDAIGVVKFLNTVAEIARGGSTPSILPLWRRGLMDARDPPRETCTGPIDEDQHHIPSDDSQDDLVCRTFVFDDKEVAALRACVPQHLRPCTDFELVSACIWHCRTIALQYRPDEEVRLAFSVNIRDKLDPPLPSGYYGNACAVAIAVSPAGEICNNSFGYTVELVKKAKGAMTEKHVVESLVDLAVVRGHSLASMPNTYNMSDVSSRIFGFPSVDFGWGKPVYAGPPDNGFVSHCFSFIMAYRNGKGKVVSVSLPVDAMDRFVKAFGSFLMMDPAL